MIIFRIIGILEIIGILGIIGIIKIIGIIGIIGIISRMRSRGFLTEIERSLRRTLCSQKFTCRGYVVSVT